MHTFKEYHILPVKPSPFLDKKYVNCSKSYQMSVCKSGLPHQLLHYSYLFFIFICLQSQQNWVVDA